MWTRCPPYPTRGRPASADDLQRLALQIVLLIRRMVRVDWPAVLAYCLTVAERSQVTLAGVMAVRTKRLDCTEAELVPIATVFLNMICHCCLRNAPFFQAHSA